MTADSQAVYQQLLVVRSQLGDRDALAEIVKLWEPRLTYYVRRLLSLEQDAQQVMQEVWLKVLSGLGKLHDPARFAPWLYTLTRYTVMDHLRDSYTRRQLLSGDKTEELPDDNDESLRFDDAEQVHYGLSQISVVDREVLTLFFLNDLSVSDVADVLKVPVGTVKSRLYYARKALFAVLQRQGEVIA